MKDIEILLLISSVLIWTSLGFRALQKILFKTSKSLIVSHVLSLSGLKQLLIIFIFGLSGVLGWILVSFWEMREYSRIGP